MTRARALIRDGVVTHAGMAHFAGTGPAGRACRNCSHWSGPKASSASAFLAPAICLKRKSIMGGKPGERVPADACACSHFVERQA